jgi:hypothetical protein
MIFSVMGKVKNRLGSGGMKRSVYLIFTKKDLTVKSGKKTEKIMIFAGII